MLSHSFFFPPEQELSGICCVENEQKVVCFTAVKMFEADVCVPMWKEAEDTQMSKMMQAAECILL